LNLIILASHIWPSLHHFGSRSPYSSSVKLFLTALNSGMLLRHHFHIVQFRKLETHHIMYRRRLLVRASNWFLCRGWFGMWCRLWLIKHITLIITLWNTKANTQQMTNQKKHV